ncbi:hypothetical protein BX666DRAFT_2027599 [Dichotomocladium elegans]|nr:hypothetical protein BX666DRAFT_2027599 [Dichotomocladium elegans]
MAMMAYPWIRAVIASILLLHAVRANLAPSYPEPGTVWTAGKEYKILWEDDGTKPRMDKAWKNFRIDLMTGDNMKQILVTHVASNVSAENGRSSFDWKAPHVMPPAAVYFFTFTNEQGDNAWTTRFAIVGDDGKLEEPEHPLQPSGEKIPWGIGKLAPSAKKQVTQDNAAVASSQQATSAAVSTGSPEPSNALSPSITHEKADAGGDLTPTRESSAVLASSAAFWQSAAAIALLIMMTMHY